MKLRERTEAIGARVQQHRKNKGWTQREFGERIGVTQSAVNAIEQGRNSFKVETLYVLADALDVHVSQLLFEEPIRNQEETQEDD